MNTVASCLGKSRYGSYAEADLVRRALRERSHGHERLRVFRCSCCSSWHLCGMRHKRRPWRRHRCRLRGAVMRFMGHWQRGGAT